MGRAGWPGASENVACGSRTTVARTSLAAPTRAARPRAHSQRDRECRSSWSAIDERRRAARHERQIARPPSKTSRLSNTHCIARPGSPMNGSSVTTAIEPEIHRHDRRRCHGAPRGRRSAPSRGASARITVRQREPRHGAKSRARPHPHRPAPHARRTPTCVHDSTAAGDPRAHGAAVRSIYARAGSRVHRCSGLIGSTIAAASDRCRTSRRAPARRAARPRAIGGWFSAASASGSHSISRMRGVWPLRIEPVLHGLVRRRPAILVAPGRSPAARAQAAPPCAEPTADRATRVRPSRRRRQGDGAATAASGTSSRDRGPPRSIIVTRSARSQRDVRSRRSPAETPTSRYSSRAGRAGRCPRARRFRDPRTRSRVRRAGFAPRARARARRPSPAEPPALRPGEAGADDGDVVRGYGPEQPLSEREQRLCGRGTRMRAVEHVIAAPLDPAQRLEIHGAHDFGGDKPLAILGGRALPSPADRSRARGGTRTR